MKPDAAATLTKGVSKPPIFFEFAYCSCDANINDLKTDEDLNKKCKCERNPPKKT